MKIILCSLWALLTCSLASAQIEKGRMYLGGNIGFSQNTFRPSSATQFKTTETNYTVTPSIGYLINNRVSLGVYIGYQNQRTRTFSPNLSLSDQIRARNSTFFGIHSRYYIDTSYEKFKFFVQTSASLGFVTETNTLANERYLDISVSPNFAYFFTNKWCLELNFTGIAYNSSRIRNTTGNVQLYDYTHSFILSAQSFNPSIGIRYFFK